MAKIRNEVLVSMLQQQITQARIAGQEVSEARAELIQRYFGELYGNELPGKSKFTTRDIMEAVEWIHAPISQGFLGSSRVVSFEPTDAEDEPLAEQETDVVNYKILKANNGDGYLALSDWLKDALLQPNAILKVYLNERVTEEVHHLRGIPLPQLVQLYEDPSIKFEMWDERVEQVEQSAPSPGSRMPKAPADMPLVPGLPPAPPQPTAGGPPGAPAPGAGGPPALPQGPPPPQAPPQLVPETVFDITYRKVEERADIALEAVPGERFLVDPSFEGANLDHARFLCHIHELTRDELIRRGYPASRLTKAIAEDVEYTLNDAERQARLNFEGSTQSWFRDDDIDASQRLYTVHECYLDVDLEGKGTSQFRRIVLIGDQIFENDEVAYQPFVALSSSRFPHKHEGFSVGQMLLDIQRLNTEVVRQLLDNVYNQNTQRVFINQSTQLTDQSTVTALQNPQARVIPVHGPPQQAVLFEPPRAMVGEMLPLLQHVHQLGTRRTGAATHNAEQQSQHVNMNTPYGAFMAAQEKQGARVEGIARIMAETGFKQAFRKVHYLCRARPDIVQTVKLRGEWIPVKAAEWNERLDMSVNIGLGFNSKQQMLILLQQGVQLLQQMAPAGLMAPQGMYTMVREWMEAAGFPAIDRFLVDPKTPGWQPPPPPPDPSMILAQAQAQHHMAQAQAQTMKSQLEVQQAQADQQLEQAKLQIGAQEAQVKAEQAARELALKSTEHQTEARVEAADVRLKHAQVEKLMAEIHKLAAEVQALRRESSHSPESGRPESDG